MNNVDLRCADSRRGAPLSATARIPSEPVGWHIGARWRPGKARHVAGLQMPATDPDSKVLRLSRGWACIGRLPSFCDFYEPILPPAEYCQQPWRQSPSCALCGSRLRFGCNGSARRKLARCGYFFSAGTNDGKRPLSHSDRGQRRTALGQGTKSLRDSWLRRAPICGHGDRDRGR